MKKILSSLLLLLISGFAYSQNFTELTLQQAQEKAKKENKIILADVLNQYPISDQKKADQKMIADFAGVKEFMEANIVPIVINMKTDVREVFAPMLQMNMYPTYAFLMPDGDLLTVIHPSIAAKDPSAFLKKANEAWTMATNKWNNSRQINFLDLTFEQALAQAKKENKLVFVDAITENCQPCMKMAKNVFTLDNVADFHNKSFINVKLNLGTEHKDLAAKYGTVGYPSYLYIDGDGKLVSLESGYVEADKFLSYGKAALEKINVGIVFFDGTWSEVLAKAKNENKPIFMDCYTEWCGPCKQMANVVFKEKAVADYFNANFVNVKFDMEKGEGIDLKKKFAVAAYPTFLYIAPDGGEIHRIVGSSTGDRFVAATAEAMKSGGIARLKAKYDAGERSPEFLKEYLKGLEGGYMKAESQIVVNELFKTFDKSQILDNEEYWKLFVKFINDVDSEHFKFFSANRDKFYAKYDERVVDQKFNLAWSTLSRNYAKVVDGKPVFDKKGYDSFKKRLKKEYPKRYDNIVFDSDLYNAEVAGDWKTYVSLIEKRGLENTTSIALYNWILRIDQKCTDKEIRAKAATWCDHLVTNAEQLEAKRKAEFEKTAQPGMGMAASMINTDSYKRLKQNLLK